MKIKEITSRTNEVFKRFDSLSHSRGIKKENLVLVSGRKILPEVLKKFSSENLIFTEKNQNEAFDLAEKFGVSHGIQLSNELFSELDESGTGYPLVAIKAPVLESYKNEKTKGLSVFLALSDPANLGATLRSLKAFEVSQVILLKESAHPFLPKVTKAASGLNLSLNLKTGPSIQELDLESSIGLDMEGTPLKSFVWPENAQLILGEEGKGLPDHLRDHAKLLRIEMSKEAESLSAPIAVSIASYDYYSKTLK